MIQNFRSRIKGTPNTKLTLEQAKKSKLMGNMAHSQASKGLTGAGSTAKNKDPNSHEVHFFESPSRYIPLKVFNQLYGSTFSSQM